MMCEKYRNCATKFSEKLCWLPSLLSRLVLAAVFLQTGWGKLHHIENVAGFFMQFGIKFPTFAAYLVGYTELICGAALLLGFLTRFASVLLSVIMIMALMTVHATEVQNFSALLSLAPFLYLILLIGLIVRGAGKISVDAFCCKCPNTLSSKKN